MRNRVFVRPAKEYEGKLFFDWAAESEVNNFDPEVPRFPSTVTWCAYDKDGPLAFQPVQRPLMLDSTAIRPGATKEQAVVAFRELVQNAVTQAHIVGAGEIYFLGSDQTTSDLAKNQAFEELDVRIYRLKVKATECGSAQN